MIFKVILDFCKGGNFLCSILYLCFCEPFLFPIGDESFYLPVIEGILILRFLFVN